MSHDLPEEPDFFILRRCLKCCLFKTLNPKNLCKKCEPYNKCTTCETWKDISEFYKNNKSRCRPCVIISHTCEHKRTMQLF